MKKEILRFEDITYKRGTSLYLKKVSLSLYEGELLSIMGLSNSGIDIFPGILSGETAPDEGRLYIDGQPAVPGSITRFQQEHHIYCLNSSCTLFPKFTIAENFAAIRKTTSSSFFVNRKKAGLHTQGYLDFAGLPLDASAPAACLSQSQSHLVQIMKFVSWGARVIILDRIAALYSVHDFVALLQLVRKLKHISFIYIGTQPDLIAELSDRIQVLRGGSTAGVLHHDVYSGNLLLSMMTKNQPHETPGHVRLQPGGKAVLELDRVPVGEAFLSAKVHDGEILGIVDSNNSFSRLEQMLFPARRVNAPLKVNGQPVSSLEKAVSHGLAFVNGAAVSSSYIGSFTLQENLSFQLLNKSFRSVKKRISDHIYDSCIQSFSSAELDSRGQSFDLKTLLFRCLYARPTAIIINHITALLDPVQAGEILSVVHKIASDGIGILLVTSDIFNCYNLCSRILCPTRQMEFVEFDTSVTSYQELLQFIYLQDSAETSAPGAYLF